MINQIVFEGMVKGEAEYSCDPHGERWATVTLVNGGLEMDVHMRGKITEYLERMNPKQLRVVGSIAKAPHLSGYTFIMGEHVEFKK